MDLWIILAVFLFAFILEFVDAFAGLGYGTLAPALLLLGFAPLELIPAVIITSMLLSIIAGVMHHFGENVDFSLDSKSLKIALILMGFGIIGVLIGVFVALNIPEYILKTYIGAMIIILGFATLFLGRIFSFSWLKVISLGALASFNKGMTGGGYGPVLANGQILSGINSKSAVAITALSEGIVSAAGIIAYVFVAGISLNWTLIIVLSIGGILSTPLAVYTMKKIHPSKVKKAVAIASIIIGIIIILNGFLW